VFDAAMSLYAEAGWAGFNFDAIAKRAGVGKAALYRRWESRGELLRTTFEARWYVLSKIDTGTLQGDLLALGQMTMDVMTGPYGDAAKFMTVDDARHAEVRTSTAPWRESTIRQAKAIVRRAAARGELPPNIEPGLLLDLVVGGVNNHINMTPARLRAPMVAKSGEFLSLLVDVVLRGVHSY
jgi:AcrR family transcriptional regulator